MLKKGQAHQKLERHCFQEVSEGQNLKTVLEQILIKINFRECVQTHTKGKVWIKECKSFHILVMKGNYFRSLKLLTLKTKECCSVGL